jgi:hypothetical protein
MLFRLQLRAVLRVSAQSHERMWLECRRNGSFLANRILLKGPAES